MNSPNHSSPDLTALDAITGGALTAATSGERLTRVREWLNTEPALDVLQTVFKELSARDKGAAKPVKEKIGDGAVSKTPVGEEDVIHQPLLMIAAIKTRAISPAPT